MREETQGRNTYDETLSKKHNEETQVHKHMGRNTREETHANKHRERNNVKEAGGKKLE